MKVVAIGFNSPLARSEWLMLLSSGLGFLHHIRRCHLRRSGQIAEHEREAKTIGIAAATIDQS